MGHFQAVCRQTKSLVLQDDSMVNTDGHTCLDEGGSAEQPGLDMVHLMLCTPEQERDDAMGSWSAVLPSVKQAHTVEKPKLCPPHARDQPWHIRKRNDPALLGFQHRILDSLWPGKKELQEIQAVPGFFSCKCFVMFGEQLLVSHFI